MTPRHAAYKLVDTLENLSRLTKGGGPLHFQLARWWSTAIPVAEHFLLPDGGKLLHGVSSVKELAKVAREDRGIIKLPFPCICIEATLNVLELDAAPTRSPIQSGGTSVAMPLVLLAATGEFVDEWSAGQFGNIAPTDIIYWSAFLRPSGEFSWAPLSCVLDLDVTIERGIFSSMPRWPIGGREERLASGETIDEVNAEEAVAVDTGALLTELVLALSCSNVRKSAIAPSARLNRSRAKRGKQPFAEYHILELVDSVESGSGGGTHRSPAFHLRRGHIRRLHTGKRIWVNWCFVGSTDDGIVSKTYDAKKLESSPAPG